MISLVTKNKCLFLIVNAVIFALIALIHFYPHFHRNHIHHEKVVNAHLKAMNNYLHQKKYKLN